MKDGGAVVELVAEDLDEILDYNSKSVVEISELPGDNFCMFFGDGLVDVDVHVSVHHFIGVDFSKVHVGGVREMPELAL